MDHTAAATRTSSQWLGPCLRESECITWCCYNKLFSSCGCTLAFIPLWGICIAVVLEKKGALGEHCRGDLWLLNTYTWRYPTCSSGGMLVSAGSPRSPGPLLDQGTFECYQILGSNNPEAPKDKTFGLLTSCRQIVSGQHKKTLLSMSAVFEHAQYPVRRSCFQLSMSYSRGSVNLTKFYILPTFKPEMNWILWVVTAASFR